MTDECSNEIHGHMDCPKCKTRQEVEPVTVLKPATEQLGLLFRGELNKVTCSSCGAEFILQVPILFRDDDNFFLIYYMPLENPRDYVEAEAQMQTITGQIFAQEVGVEQPECRLTLSNRQFIEKIALHLNQLDDCLIEYLKYQLYNQEANPIDSVRNEMLYDFSNQEADRIAFIIFNRESGEAAAATHVPMDLYQELREDIATNPDLSEELAKLFPGYYVSVERLI